MLYFWESNHIRICIRKMTFLNIIKIYPTVTNDFLSATTNPEWYNMLNDPKRRNLKKYFVSISNLKTPFLSKLILKWSLEDLTIFYFAGMQPMIWLQSMSFSLFQWTITQKLTKFLHYNHSDDSDTIVRINICLLQNVFLSFKDLVCSNISDSHYTFFSEDPTYYPLVFVIWQKKVWYAFNLPY